MISASPGTEFDASLELGPAMTGLVGILGVRIIDPGVQETPVPRTTAGVHEFPVGSGIYGARLRAPLGPGLYIVMWDTQENGPFTAANSWGEPLTILIEDPQFPGGWSWTPYGWLQPGWDMNVSTSPAGSNPIPVAADVRASSKLAFEEFGYEDDAGPGGLQELVDRAESTFWRITGQTLDQIDPKYAPLVRRVIQGLTEQMAMQSAPEQLDTLADFDLIASFSAGPYSETRRSPMEMFQARMLNPVPWLSDALWSLLDADRYAFYMQLFTGQNMPAWTTSDVFWEEGQQLGRMFGPAPGYFWGA